MNTNIFPTLVAISQSIAYFRTNEDMRCKHTAYIIKKGRIVAIGVNCLKTHPKILWYKYPEYRHGAIHAELRACLNGRRSIYDKHSLVVIRVDNNGKLNLSKPCLGCQDVIQHFRFREVWYTDQKGEFVQL